MEYFKTPHIPDRCVKCVIAGGGISRESVKTLNSFGIEVISAYKSENLLSPIAAHADMTILHLGGNRFVCSPDSYEYYKACLAGAEIIHGKIELKNDYPNDIAYNITLLNNRAFLNTASTQAEIVKTYTNGKYTSIKVKQGYTKCNICIVSSTAIITSDTGIYNAAEKNGIDALLIQPGHIELKGMNCGFIGGAAGLIAPSVLAVNGDIKNHPNADAIIEFCRNHSVEIAALKSGVLEDIGSVLPIF